jgi:hypothetical protein
MPHFRAMLTIVFLSFLHAAQLAIVFHIPPDYILPATATNKTVRWIEGLVFFGALTGICTLIFPKKRLDEQQVSDTAISKGKKILPWYFAGTILLLIVLVIIHGVRKGTIRF